MATEALEHDFFKSNSLNRGTSSTPSGSSSCHDDSCQSNPQQQVEGSLKSCTSSLPSPVKEDEDLEDQTKVDEEDDDKEQQQLLEASQDSGVGTQDAEDSETWQERDKNSSLTDSLLTDTTEVDLFECRELEEWGWEEEGHGGPTANRPSHEDASSLVKPPAKRIKHDHL